MISPFAGEVAVQSGPMIKLFDSAFSPFARKIRIVLDHKGLEHEAIDGLDVRNRDALSAVNGRLEVPVLVHEGISIVNSSDIVLYLERAFPEKSVFPSSLAEWPRARAWERCADTLVDAALTNISYWAWAERHDSLPPGLREAASRDLRRVYAALEDDLSAGAFVCGQELTIADIALFPHLRGTRSLGVGFTEEAYPRLTAWFARLCKMDIFKADVARAKAFMANGDQMRNYERRKLFWRGDRIEWMLARGYHEWFMGEIAAERVIWPGADIPAPRRRAV